MGCGAGAGRGRGGEAVGRAQRASRREAAKGIKSPMQNAVVLREATSGAHGAGDRPVPSPLAGARGAASGGG